MKVTKNVTLDFYKSKKIKIIYFKLDLTTSAFPMMIRKEKYSLNLSNYLRSLVFKESSISAEIRRNINSMYISAKFCENFCEFLRETDKQFSFS